MFGIKEIRNRIELLEAQVRELKSLNENIGEIYGKSEYYWYGTFRHTAIVGVSNTFIPFKQSDINESYDGGIKIFGTWYPKEDVLMYDDIYKEIRSKISKKYEKK